MNNISISKYHHGNLRETLLALALEQIIKNGVESLSMRKLAKQAGVSHAAPARHFPSKKELLSALIASFHDELTAYINQHVDTHGSLQGKESLVLMVEATLRWSRSNPSKILAIMNPDINRFTDERVRRRLRGRIETIVQHVLFEHRHRDITDSKVQTIVTYMFGAGLGIAYAEAHPIFKDTFDTQGVDIKAIADHIASVVLA